MKNLLYSFALIVLLFSCNEDEGVIQAPVDAEQEEVAVDPIAVDLLELDTPNQRAYFVIFDFTARIPGYIWGCTYPQNGSTAMYAAIFSYDLATDEIKIFEAPSDFDIRSLEEIEAGPDGKLYVMSGGLYRGVAAFDPVTEQWSTIEVPGFARAITVNEETNTLWIAHSEGVSSYQDGEVFTYNRSNSDLLISDPDDTFFHSLYQ